MSRNDYLFWKKAAEEAIVEKVVLENEIEAKAQEVLELKNKLFNLERLQRRYEVYANRHNNGLMADDEHGQVKTKESFYLR